MGDGWEIRRFKAFRGPVPVLGGDAGRGSRRNANR